MTLRDHNLIRCLLLCAAFMAASLASAEGLFGPIQAGDTAGFNAALQAGADINAADEYGQTPLMYAVTFNQPDMVEALIAAGADVNARTLAGWTALHYAARDANESRMLRDLLSAGASPTAKNQAGDTPDAVATSAGNRIAAETLEAVGKALRDAEARAVEQREAAERAALARRVEAEQADAERRAHTELVQRLNSHVGERDGQRVFWREYPMRTGDFPGWYIILYGSQHASDIRVYVVNEDSGDFCGWNVNIAQGIFDYPEQGVRVSPAGTRVPGGLALPSFDYRPADGRGDWDYRIDGGRGRGGTSLVVDVHAGQCLTWRW